MTLTIAALITVIQFWLRLATFLHGPLKSFLLHVLHNLSNDPTYNGLPQDPQKLYQELSTPANRKKINDLKNGTNGKKKVLQQDQVDALRPPTGNATDSSQFDVTLICILIINFTNLPAPLKGWKNKNPPATDLSIGAFVIRAREWRNYIHHTDPDKINQAQFNQKWTEGEQIINNLGFTYDTTQLKTMLLDLKYENVVKSMYLYLERKQDTLSKQQMALETKQTALDTKQTALDSKHTTLADNQAALENEHKSLDNQQASLSQDVTDLQISTTQIGNLAQQLSLHQNLSSEEIKALTNRLEEIVNIQQSMRKNLPMLKYHSEPSQTLRPSKNLRVEKITPKEVAFTAEETSIIYTVQCWKIKNEMKMIESVKNVTSTNINQKAWIQCEVDIKSGYTYEFVFNTDRADDSKIIVQLPRNHHHTSRKGETLVYAHNCGRPSNIHAFEVSDENGITDDDTCIPISTGPSVANTVKEFNQRAMQYYKDHIGTKTFPPSYYVRNVNMKEVIASLEEHSSLLGGKILVGYNPISHLRILGLNDEKIESVLHFSECPDYYDNTIVCIYPNRGLLFVFVVGENEKHIDKDLAKVNAVLKTWCYVHRQILQNEQFTIVGVLVLPASSDLNKMKQHPCLNLNTKSQDFVISFDENFGQWLTNFLKLIRDNRKLSSPSTPGIMEIIAGNMMASMAQTKIYLPRVSGNDTINVKTILLTEPQISCIEIQSNWKMIQASYGAGKSITLHEIARKLLKMSNQDLIINVTFDPFSALDKKVDHSFNELCKQEKLTQKRENLISLSLSEAVGERRNVTDFYNCSSLPSKNIADVMLLLKNKHKHRKIHFLFDEVPQELFTKTYSETLRSHLESEFRESVVVIALQSVQKSRKITEEGKVTNSQEIVLKSSGMELFKLPNTMRMSSCLHKLKEVLEGEIESSPCSLNLEIRSKGNVLLTKDESNKAIIEETQSNGDDENRPGSSQSTTKVEFQVNERKEDREASESFDPTKLRDPENVFKSQPQTSENEEVVKELSTTYTYMKGKCGHSFMSSLKPRIFHFTKAFTPLFAWFLPILAAVLQFCLNERKEDEVVVLCEDICQVKMVQYALERIHKRPIAYAPYLTGEYPQDIHKMKEKFVKNLDELETVLISDYRSVRGLEMAHTIIFVDPENEANAHFLVEAITRTITNLDVISTKPFSQNASTSIERAFQKYVDGTLAIKTHVESSKDAEDLLKVQFQYNEKDGSKQTKIISQKLTDFSFDVSQSLDDFNKNQELWQNYFRMVFTLSTSISSLGTNKWDGKTMRSVTLNDGTTLSFDDVWKILKEKKFAKFEEIFHQKPNIVNSMRGVFGYTLLMEAVVEDRFDVFVHLMNYPQDFSLVDNEDGLNVLHLVGYYGTVRHLEQFDQQTIKKLINGRDGWNRTSLHRAAQGNNHDVIRWLLAKGADHELKNKDGQRPDEHPDCDGFTKEIFRSFRSS
ncbi:uncharacterized protein [Clytia hemisphaerica]